MQEEELHPLHRIIICRKEEGEAHIFCRETNRTCLNRYSEHQRALRTTDDTFATVKHLQIHHFRKEPIFLFKLKSTQRASTRSRSRTPYILRKLTKVQ